MRALASSLNAVLILVVTLFDLTCSLKSLPPRANIISLAIKNTPNANDKEWKSGQEVFKQPQRRRGRNDPWWMRDEEKNNPRVLPRYLPWWLTNSGEVDETLKVVELRGLADQIGIDHNGLKKADLLNLLRESVKLYSLTDDNFKKPVFIPTEVRTRPSCYPEIYEESPQSIDALRQKIMSTPPPSAQPTRR